MLRMRLQLFVIAFLLFNVAVCWVNYDYPVDVSSDPRIWSNNLDYEDNVPMKDHDLGVTTYSYKSDELAVFTKKHSHQLYSCIKFLNHKCEVSVYMWPSLNVAKYIYSQPALVKIEMTVGFPNIPWPVYRYIYDVETYGTPFATFIVNDEPQFKAVFISGAPYWRLPKPTSGNVITITDHANECGNYRPIGNTSPRNVMSTAFYLNYKEARYKTYPYLFVKKDNHVCVFRFTGGSHDFNHWKPGDVHEYVFSLINNYPTEGYAPNFFTVDPLYGTFVSLFWDKVEGNPPEAHFYEFDENDPKQVHDEPYDKFALTDFDRGVLKDIFDEKYDDENFPVFQCFGRQVFISFKQVDNARNWFSGLWKDAETFFFLDRPVDGFYKNVHIRKDYIQVHKPISPFDPDPYRTTTTRRTTTTTTTTTTKTTTTTTTPSTTTEATTSTSKSTTTEATTSPSTSTTTTTRKTTTTTPSTTTEATHPPSTSSGYPNSTTVAPIPHNNYDYDNDYDNGGHEAGADSHQSNERKDGCVQIPPLWLLILFIILDILLLIILIILIILTRCGSKKRKAKPRMSKKSKAAAATPTTESKKSKKKRKTGMDATKFYTVKDKKTADSTKYYTVKNKKSANTTKYYTVKGKNKTAEQGTQFYTLDTTFDHSVKKKGRKK